MKIYIYGAGAIIGYIGVHLARGGADVSLVARGPHLKAMQTNGLRIITADDDFTVLVRADNDPAAFGVQDYVFITLKSYQMDAELVHMQPLLEPGVFSNRSHQWPF